MTDACSVHSIALASRRTDGLNDEHVTQRIAEVGREGGSQSYRAARSGKSGKSVTPGVRGYDEAGAKLWVDGPGIAFLESSTFSTF